jgi:hypothetical protein
MRLLAAAVVENAAWCDLVCRTAGLRGRWDDALWACAERTPALHPDAVTLAATATAPHVLGRIDTGPGCSVKDSWATLALGPAGFEVLLEASWVARLPGPPGRPSPPIRPLRWTAVPDAPALGAWDVARAAPASLAPALLGVPGVTVLAGRRDADRGADDPGGDVVAGAVLHRRDEVIGVSNVWSAEGDLDGAWAGAVVAAGRMAPRLAVVGYESGTALEAARRAGCTPLGPLRVWRRP